LPEYSDASVNIFGKPAGPWRLFDTGEFYRGFFVRIEGGRAIFDSRDSKTTVILQRLDERRNAEPTEIFGLNKANLRDLARNYILPDLQAFVRQTIRGR
jgi:hypothetical protein